jgi:hypothetical protein
MLFRLWLAVMFISKSVKEVWGTHTVDQVNRARNVGMNHISHGHGGRLKCNDRRYIIEGVLKVQDRFQNP